MKDWEQLARTWQSCRPQLAEAELERMLHSARREALRWRLTWIAAQACVPLVVGVSAWMLWRADGWAMRGVAAGFLSAALYAWLASRKDMAQLLNPVPQSTLGHLQAQLARTQAMRRFVRIDFIVYLGMAAMAAVFSIDHQLHGAWLGINWDGRDAPWLMWALVAVGVGYDLFRLRRAERRKAKLQRLLSMIRAEGEISG